MMKKLFLFTALAAGLATAPAAAAKSPIEGRWKDGSMVIDIAPCGSNLCGTVVKASPKQQARAERGSDTELIGARLITGIRRTGPGTYRGRVFVADRDIHASGSIRQLNRNQLSVKGCVLAVICKSRTWDRVR